MLSVPLRLFENPACKCGNQNTLDALRRHDECLQRFQNKSCMPFEERAFAEADVIHMSHALAHSDRSSWNSLITAYVSSGEMRHALFVYDQQLDDDSVHINGHTYVYLLKACAALKDLVVGYVVHADLARNGLLERDAFIGSTLIDTYAKCGSIVKAQEVFDKLPYWNIVSWTALIAGYTKHGHGDKALNIVQKMQHAGISSNSHTYVCILKACSDLQDAEKGRDVHAEILKRGLESEIFIRNTLVDLYARCGLLDSAHAVLEKLPVPDAVPWNALITGYVEHGDGEKALKCFEAMQCKGTIYDYITISCCLKACGCVGATAMGERLHSEIYKAGWEKDHLINTFLVDMYAKCGSMVEAQEILDKVLVRDVVLWTALITGYIKHDYAAAALDFFERMQQEGISPNVCTLVCALKACGNVGSVEKGEKIYSSAVEKGLEGDLLISNTLIDFYAKCRLPETAQALFGKLSSPDKISWNALIAGFSEHDNCQDALNCFELMKQSGIPYDSATLLSCLKACDGTSATPKGQEMHMDICLRGLDKDPIIGNSLLSMYARCGLPSSARYVFDKLALRETYSWNALLAGSSIYRNDQESDHADEALNCEVIMHLEGISPNAQSYIIFLKACVGNRDIHKIRELHAGVVTKGLEKEHLIGHVLIDVYSKCGLLVDACELFNRLQVKDVASSTSLIAGYIELGLGEKTLTLFESLLDGGVSPDAVMFVYALRACVYLESLCIGRKMHMYIARLGWEAELRVGTILIEMYAKHGLVAESYNVFNKLSARDVLSWNALISGYAEHGFGDKAFRCFNKMVSEGISWDSDTSVITLKACGSIGASMKGQKLHMEIITRGLEADLLVSNILVDMYGKCGMLVEALGVFDKVFDRDIVSWNAAIATLAQWGECKCVFHCLGRMVEEGITPDLVSCMNALQACSHQGLVDEGCICFGAIRNEFGLVPVVEHYTCMADLLGRAGLIDQAGAIMQHMPLHPDMVGWVSVLGACQKRGNLDLGRRAFKHAVLLDEYHSSVYICMSNIFASVAQKKKW